MRDGIYRVWFKGPDGNSTGALAFRNGDILGCDSAYASVGHYSLHLGRLSGEMKYTRLNPAVKTGGLPDLDEFHLLLEGTPGRDVASLRGTIREIPAYYLLCEMAWVNEP